MSDAGAGEVGSVKFNHTAEMSADQIESILADFRTWLTSAPPPAPTPNVVEPPRVDLQTLLAQFTALRQEVNLQTKATRTANEQCAEALKLLANPPKPADPDAPLRPIIKVLLEVADALKLGSQQLERTKGHLAPLLAELEAIQVATWPEMPELQPEEKPTRPGFFTRVFGATPSTPVSNQHEWLAWAETVNDLHTDQELALERITQRWSELLKGISDGYAMSLRRVERTWPSLNLEPIPTVGKPFDPETMEAVELVEGNPSGYVVEETRTGYRWNGKLFRFAQVKVAR
jgi:molecular chaperone GrpE